MQPARGSANSALCERQLQVEISSNVIPKAVRCPAPGPSHPRCVGKYFRRASGAEIVANVAGRLHGRLDVGPRRKAVCRDKATRRTDVTAVAIALRKG